MGKQENSLGAKERILNTADRLFYEQGYRKTGVNQLIEEANVAKASFYSNFSSKNILLREYLKKRHNDWFRELHQIVDQYEDPGEKIIGLFEFLEKWISETNFRGCAFININIELPDDGGEITRIVQKHKQQLRDLIEELVHNIENPTRSKEELDLISDTIYFLVEAAIVESQNFNKMWPVERALKSVKKMI